LKLKQILFSSQVIERGISEEEKKGKKPGKSGIWERDTEKKKTNTHGQKETGIVPAFRNLE